MKAGTRCAGLFKGGRPCPSNTRNPSGRCSQHRQASIEKAARPVVRWAEEWYAARESGFVLDRLEAEGKLREYVALLREARGKP